MTQPIKLKLWRCVCKMKDRTMRRKGDKESTYCIKRTEKESA
jgi:hypothetical protein